jgi:DNA-binding NarL/FixJ family response regulator
MNTEPPLIRILAVDDHPLLREGIVALISIAPDMQLVGACSNGREAIEQFRALRPDVTLMDLQMPVMSGLEAIVAIRGDFPDARIIVLTTYAGDVEVVRAFKAGASAFLVKNLAHQELLDTIRSVHRGQKVISPEVSRELSMDGISPLPEEE